MNRLLAAHFSNHSNSYQQVAQVDERHCATTHRRLLDPAKPADAMLTATILPMLVHLSLPNMDANNRKCAATFIVTSNQNHSRLGGHDV